MKQQQTNKTGFTLVEVCVASAILVVVIAMAMRGFTYALQGSNQSTVQEELDINVQSAMERLKYDLRLSALNEMYYYPEGAGPFTAISFPLARDDDGDQRVEVDADNYIIWDRTLIYHVKEGTPYQLLLTIFDPRDNTLTEAERQEQINDVVATGSGTSTHNSANASTIVVFQNLFEWSISPNGSTYDAYASSTRRDTTVNLGSVVITPGPHKFKFTVTGKNAHSTGYHIGLDTLLVSVSDDREAEAQLPASALSGALPINQYMPSGSWSGNHQLYFPATAIDQSFTLTMNNDQWEETNFRRTGYQADQTSVSFDQTLNPYDYVIKLDGCDIAWKAAAQAGNSIGSMPTDVLKGCAVRVLVRGAEMPSGNWIEFNGQKISVNFRAGTNVSQKLYIKSAYIAECATTNTPSMNTTGIPVQLKFNNGNSYVDISGGTNKWSDYADFPISEDKSYLISYLIDGAVAKGNPFRWDDIYDPLIMGCHIIPASSAPTAADLVVANWDVRPDVISTNGMIGVQYIYATYPSKGSYTSGIFDTQLKTPAYKSINCNADTPSDSLLTMKVRTGNTNTLSDALAWTNITAMAGPGVIAPGTNRYVQFQATLTPDSTTFHSPILKDVTIDWIGDTKLVNIGGIFTKGTNYGIFKIEVDDAELVSGVTIDLEIFRETRGFKGSRKITSKLLTEVHPRNTGK